MSQIEHNVSFWNKEVFISTGRTTHDVLEVSARWREYEAAITRKSGMPWTRRNEQSHARSISPVGPIVSISEGLKMKMVIPSAADHIQAVTCHAAPCVQSGLPLPQNWATTDAGSASARLKDVPAATQGCSKNQQPRLLPSALQAINDQRQVETCSLQLQEWTKCMWDHNVT